MTTQLSERTQTRKRSPAVADARRLCGEYGNLWQQLNWPGSSGVDSAVTLGLTSCSHQEGVSTLATLLAVEAATCFPQHRVALVDANLKSPSLHHAYQFELTPGLADCLGANQDPAACLHETDLENLCLLTAGGAGQADVEIDHTEMLEHLVKSLHADFDLVVFDLPPVGESGWSIQVARLLDGVLLVVESERIRAATAQRITEQLHRASVQVTGAILNKRKRYLTGWLRREP